MTARRRPRLPLGWWLACGLGLMWPAAAVRAEPTPGYQMIQRAFLREEFATVATLAQTFITQNPEVPEVKTVWLWLALSLDRLQRPEEALDQLDRLKGHLGPSDAMWPEVVFWEGDISRRASQMLRAKMAYQRLLEQYPDSTWAAQAQLGLGLIYVQQQAYEPAVGHLHEVALRRPGSPIALDALLFEGLCQLRLSHHEDAVAIFEPLLLQLRDPATISQATFYLGESYSGWAHHADAVAAYRRSIAADERSSWSRLSRFGLGWSLYQLDRCDESVEAFESYLSDMTQLPSGVGHDGQGQDHRIEALFAQASCLVRLGREPSAVSRFERVIADYPGHALALESGLALVDAMRREGRLSSARTLLHQMLRWTLGVDARARINLQLGAIALEQGNAAQARTILDAARESRDPAMQQAALSGLGNVQLYLGDLMTARRFYDKAVQRDPNSLLAGYAAYQMGRIDLQLGSVDRAVEAFQRLASGADPSIADEARLALVVAQLSQRQEAAARSQLEALRRDRAGSLIAARAGYYAALLALNAGEEAAAQQLCYETMAKAPRTDEAVEARLLLAESLAQRTSVREAMDWLWESYADPALPVRLRAKLAKHLGDFARTEQAYAKAIRWYEEAAGLLPSLSGETSYRIASCYEEAGDLGLAIQWYRGIDQQPWHVRGRLAMAKLLERQGRVADAQHVYEALAEEPVPEAKIARERSAMLREEHENSAKE